MAKRKRSIKLEVYVSEEENELINQKMSQLGTTNFSAYARKMLIDGYAIKYDFAELKGITAELGKIGSNVNQIAKRANEKRIVRENDIKEMLEMLQEIKKIVNRRISKLIK